MKFKKYENKEEIGYLFNCPCGGLHSIRVAGVGPKWGFNEDVDKPTVQPSLLVQWPDGKRCHSFIIDGRIQFLSDCTHKYAGTTVEIPEWED